MEELMKILGVSSISEMLLATTEDLEKCKSKDSDVSDHTINSVYARAAIEKGIRPMNAYELCDIENSK